MNDKDKIKQLENKIQVIEKSPHYESYRVIQAQLMSFNEQLTIRLEKPIGTSDENYRIKGFINLFASKDAKEFDRAKWYFENVLELNKTLAELKKMMSPIEIKEQESTSDIDDIRGKVKKEIESAG